nr:hypothetical protein [uncultured Methanobacterium sp.]
MNLRPVIGSLIICLMLQYSIGGLYANATFLNDSGVSNNSIVVPENTTVNADSGMLNNIVASPENTTVKTYTAYPLNCPKWDDYKDKHPSPIQNFGDYLDDLENYVKNFDTVDDENIQQSKANYENNSGYFSENPVCGDYDYRYMPTSELNEAYAAASVAKSRISLPDALSTKLQAQYTVASVILGALSGICGVCSAVAAIATAGTAGGASPVLVVFAVITGLITATTIAIGICSAVVANRSAGITVEKGKIDTRLAIMNAELTYRASLPKDNTTSLKTRVNVSENESLSTDSFRGLSLTTNGLSLTNGLPLIITPSVAVNKTNSTDLNNTTNSSKNNETPEKYAETTNTINTTGKAGGENVYGVNDVSPTSEPIPGDITVSGSGTFMDNIGDIDISGFPEKPQKPHPKWYQFWLWIDYGFKCTAWAGHVLAWGFGHMDSLNNVISLCNDIQSEIKYC